MRIEMKIAVPYSIVFLMDMQHGETETMNGNLVAATTSCVAVGASPDSEGATRIVLTNERETKDQSFVLVFDGTVETPNGEISVCRALNESVLTLKLDANKCCVSIWVNSIRTPDEIEIFAESWPG